MEIKHSGYRLMVTAIILALELGVVFSSGCPRLVLPNGRVRFRSRGRTAQFKCSRGFTRVGARMAVCLKSKQWSQKIPLCVGRGCPALNLPDIMKAVKMFRGGMTFFNCAPGYTRHGPENIFCDGKNWNAEPPTCQPGISLGCDFEEQGLCGWSQVLKVDDMNWVWHKGATPTKDTGPQVDHTTGTKEGHYLFMESSGPSKKGHTAQLMSPSYEPTDVTGLCLEFYYHIFGSKKAGDIGSLEVYAKPQIVPLKRLTTDKRVVSLFSITGNKGDVWIGQKTEIPVFNQPFQFIFVAQRQQSWLSDIALDDIRLYNCTEDATTTSTSPPTTVALTSPLGDDIQSSSSASLLYRSISTTKTKPRRTTQKSPTTVTKRLRTTSTTEETTRRRKRTTTNLPATTRRRTRKTTTTPEMVTPVRRTRKMTTTTTAPLTTIWRRRKSTTDAATATYRKTTTTTIGPTTTIWRRRKSTTDAATTTPRIWRRRKSTTEAATTTPRKTTTTTIGPTTTIWRRRKSTTEATNTTPTKRRTSFNTTPRWWTTTRIMMSSRKTARSTTTHRDLTWWSFSTTRRKTTYPKWSTKSDGINTGDKKTSVDGYLTTTLKPVRSTTTDNGPKVTIWPRKDTGSPSVPTSKMTPKSSPISSTRKETILQTPTSMGSTRDVSKSRSPVDETDNPHTFQSETENSFGTETYNIDNQQNGLTTSKTFGVGKVREKPNQSASSSQQLMPLILGVVGAVLLVAIVIAVLAYKWSKRQRMKEEKEMEDQMNIITEYVETSMNT